MVNIGVVTSVTPFEKPLWMGGVHLGDEVYSTVVLRTERNLRGTEQQFFELIVEGGLFKGTWHPTSSNAPQPILGGRYLVGMAEFNSGGYPADWPDGTNLVISTFSISPDADLPSKAVLVPELEAFCESL